MEVVVEGHDDVVPSRTNTGEKRVVLAVVAHQVDAAQPLVLDRKSLDHGPARVCTAVDHEDDLGLSGEVREDGLEPVDKRRQRGSAVEDRDDDGERVPHCRGFTRNGVGLRIERIAD